MQFRIGKFYAAMGFMILLVAAANMNLSYGLGEVILGGLAYFFLLFIGMLFIELVTMVLNALYAIQPKKKLW